MILDIDAGNSRLKWQMHYGDINAPVDSGWIPNAEMACWLDSYAWQGLAVVRLSSVTGAATDFLNRWTESRGIDIQVARVVDGVAGVRCGYRDSAKLGIDRWLALLAARQRCSEPCLVVDAGTALTVDVLNRDGLHEGGYIAPGITLMVDTLGSNTWGVRVSSPASGDLVPGVDTAQAVGHGCLAAAVGMVAGIARIRSATKLLLTGGDALLLGEHLEKWLGSSDIEIALEENLVLKGLDIALPSGSRLSGGEADFARNEQN